MVSRSINNFPTMRTTVSKQPFPKIKAAIMIAGGSYFCYSYWDTPPANFLPCTDPDKAGCCPHNQTEASFDNGLISWEEHPPVLLLQTEHDDFADPQASKFYYDTMSSRAS